MKTLKKLKSEQKKPYLNNKKNKKNLEIISMATK
jgi:hypothetical protein